MGLFRDDAWRQPIRFDGLVYGKSWPTDIDAYLHFNGRACVFIEAKYDVGAVLRRGQEWALERLCDVVTTGGMRALLLVVSHGIPAPRPVYLAEARVVRTRCNYRWATAAAGLTVRAAIDAFLEPPGPIVLTDGPVWDAPLVVPSPAAWAQYREAQQVATQLLAESEARAERWRQAYIGTRALLAEFRKEAEFV